MTGHSNRAAAALAQMTEVDPALAALALWCVHRDDQGPTRTRGDTILYGPDFALLDRPRQVGVAAHHVLHVALRHAARGAALAERLGDRFDPWLFGLAADAIVNDTLRMADHALPRPFVSLAGLLRDADRPAPSAREALADWDAERLAMALHRDANFARAARNHGEKQGFAPDLERDDSGRGERSEADWRGHLTRALEAGRQAGAGIGLLAGALADLAPPRIPWETRLRGLLARALSDTPHPSFRRPAGRWVAAEAEARRTGRPVPVFEPGRARASHSPRIVLGLDTSSSIDAATLSLFGAEIAGIAARTGAETHLIGFDTEVHTERRLPRGARDALNGIAFRRGGGTDFAPVLARAAALRPSIIVMLTDLDGPAGPPPGPPVLWVVPGVPPAPPFGTVLPLPD